MRCLRFFSASATGVTRFSLRAEMGVSGFVVGWVGGGEVGGFTCFEDGAGETFDDVVVEFEAVDAEEGGDDGGAFGNIF